MRPKQVAFYPTDYDSETIDLAREAYPHLDVSGIMRELLRQWRIRHETGGRKDQKLDLILEICGETRDLVKKIAVSNQ